MNEGKVLGVPRRKVWGWMLGLLLFAASTFSFAQDPTEPESNLFEWNGESGREETVTIFRFDDSGHLAEFFVGQSWKWFWDERGLPTRCSFPDHNNPYNEVTYHISPEFWP